MPNQTHHDLPFNLDAEKAVIGSALISKDAAITILAALEEHDFYSLSNRKIFHAMKYLRDEKFEDIDSVTVTDQLINMKELENVGGVNYLKECSDSMVSLGALQFYINSVKDNSILRDMLVTIRKIDKDYTSSDLENINDFISISEEAFKTSIERRRISDFQSTHDIAPVVKDLIAKAHANDDKNVTGLTTGYNNLNFYTQGFHPGEMIILAARPSIGKTAFALNLAYKAATRGKKPVGIFSLEMQKETLFTRLISAASNVSMNKIKSGNLTSEERIALANAINQVAEANIYIDDTPRAKINDIIQKCRRLQQKEPNLGLIVIDYLGLISVASKTEDARHNEVRKICAALKGLSMEMKIPFLILCQISRDAEKRDNKKPMLSDLRDSGAIEQDADVVLLMYRGDYYEDDGNKNKNKAEPQNDRAKKVELAKEKAAHLPGHVSYTQVKVAKNRNGAIGEVAYFFYKDVSRFDEPTDEFLEACSKFEDKNQ